MALGALLGASGAEKKKLGAALGRLGAKKGPKIGPRKSLRAPLFEVPSWVQFWTPILELTKCIFKLSNSIFKTLQEHFRMQK